MRIFLSALLLIGFAMTASAENAALPLGQLTLNGEVALVFGDQPAFVQENGTAVIPADTRIQTTQAESAASLANGDSFILGKNTTFAVAGSEQAPKVSLQKGALSLYRGAEADSTYEIGSFSLDSGKAPVTGLFAVMQDGAVVARSLDQPFSLVSKDGKAYQVSKGSDVRLTPVNDVQVILTQDDTLTDDMSDDQDPLKDEMVDDDEDNDEGAYFMEESSGDEAWIGLFGLGAAGTTAVVLGSAAVIGGGYAIYDHNDDDSSSGGGSSSPSRRPVSSVNQPEEPEPQEPPLDEEYPPVNTRPTSF